LQTTKLSPEKNTAPKHYYKQSFLGFFFKILPIFLCSHTHHHPQDELAKFGYQLETKVKKKHLRILLYFGG
jgi:hypothetical protein